MMDEEFLLTLRRMLLAIVGEIEKKLNMPRTSEQAGRRRPESHPEPDRLRTS